MTNSPNEEYFPTAIVGAGCAGLTLAHALIGSKNFPCLLLDPQEMRPEHAFSFWDDGHPNLALARSLAKKSWSKWEIKTLDRTVVKTSRSFSYSTVSSSSYEKYLTKNIKTNNGSILKTKVTRLHKNDDKHQIETSSGKSFYAKNVFDSRPAQPSTKTLFQHFLGWEVSTVAPTFDDTMVTLMDFRVPQKEGFHFMYVLPYSKTSALIESTVYSSKILSSEWYEHQITQYLKNFLSCTTYEIIYKERGAIPLNKKNAVTPFGIPIGLNAGALRASTGYAFSQIIHQVSDLAKQIKAEKEIGAIGPGYTKLENWMDKVLLDVLSLNPDLAPHIFSTILDTLKGDEFVKFMIGGCPLAIKLKIIRALPKPSFISAALRSVSP